MKLTPEIKERIDRYFDNITPQELYSLSVNTYGFSECLQLEKQVFSSVGKSIYQPNIDMSTNLEDDTSMPFAA